MKNLGFKRFCFDMVLFYMTKLNMQRDGFTIATIAEQQSVDNASGILSIYMCINLNKFPLFTFIHVLMYSLFTTHY